MKTKFIVLFASVLTFFAVILRSFQLLSFVEGNTGFFIPETERTGIILTAVIFVLLFVAFILTFTGRRQPSRIPSFNKLLSVCAVILGFAFLYEALALKLPHRIPYVLKAITCVLGFAGGIVMIWYGLLGFIKNLPFRRGLLIITVCYSFMRLVTSFVCYAPTARTADSVIDIFALCSVLVFFLYFAKIYCWIDMDKSCIRIFPFAVLSVGFCTVNTLPKLIMYLLGKPELVHSSPAFVVTDLALALFIGVFTYSLYRAKNLPVKHHTSKMMSSKNIAVKDNSFYLNR